MTECEIRSGVILAHNIDEPRVDMTKLFTGNEKKIKIFNTTIKTIIFDKKKTKTVFDFMMFKENYRLEELKVEEFGKMQVNTVLFRIRALKYLDRAVFAYIETLQLFSMISTTFNLGNQNNIWSKQGFSKLEIRGPHTTFSEIEDCSSLRYVEFGIIWSSHPSNIIPYGFLKRSTNLETIYIHRSRNFILPAKFMFDLESKKDINMTVNIWNVDSMSLSNRTKILNGINLTDGQRQILNGFGGEDAKNCKWFCDCLPNGPGACGHCDDDWDKQNCGICVRNLPSTKQDIPKAHRAYAFRRTLK